MTEKKTAEETIYEMVGIKPGADKLTPMDYGEAKACMEMFAAQELAEYKKVIEELLPIAERHVYLYGNDDSVVDRKSIIDRARKLIKP